MMINKEFWSGKKVFITGHTGFKGSWLSLWLSSLGANVTGYALMPPTQPNMFDLCGVDKLITSVTGDVRDRERLMQVMLESRPEIVIHMAAQALVRDSYTNPVDTYAINVMGTVHLLEAVRACQTVKAVVNVTTDKCYENKEWEWGYRENEPMGGYDPYSNSKGCSELVTSSYRNSFFNPNEYAQHGVALASARAGNVIGGGDWAKDRLIPDCINALINKKKVMIRNPHAIRPWQHVLEPLSGYLMLAERLYVDGVSFAESWNFGPNDSDARPVEWIVQKMCEFWGEGAAYEVDSNMHPHEAHYLKLDCSKAKMRMNWHPKWGLEYTLEKIIDWVQDYDKNIAMRNKCIQQIDEYMKS
ncbi:CDP-glucose 4,6-dehydratase [Anaerospora hongkongensis]|uniref:CDP-glucose 4,6-dehydratase n=1 Tax=Anaerospora hongkongensis TaxID=244830 RepID=UPI00289D4692|nr:CDP-glucose 4,6-dehydratase [Anaerospora hongkongensis]